MDKFLNFKDQKLEHRYFLQCLKDQTLSLRSNLVVSMVLLTLVIISIFEEHEVQNIITITIIMLVLLVLILIKTFFLKNLNQLNLCYFILSASYIFLLFISFSQDFILFGESRTDSNKKSEFNEVFRYFYIMMCFNCQKHDNYLYNSINTFVFMVGLAINIQKKHLNLFIYILILELFVFIKFVTVSYFSEQVKKNDFIMKMHKLTSDRIIIESSSHDIKSPIQAIMYITNQIRKQNNNSPQTVEECDNILIYSNKIMKLVKELFDYNKLNSQTNQIQFQSEKIDIFELIQEQDKYHQLFASQNNIQLKFHYNKTILRSINFIQDQQKLSQILDNIIGNSIKFSPDGQIDVYITYFEEAQLILFQIVDNGCGICAQVIPQLQKQFNTLNLNNLNPSGTGLGLYLAKFFTQNMGPCQELIIKSQQNYGSEFNFFIHADLSKFDKNACQQITTSNYDEILKSLYENENNMNRQTVHVFNPENQQDQLLSVVFGPHNQEEVEEEEEEKKEDCEEIKEDTQNQLTDKTTRKVSIEIDQHTNPKNSAAYLNKVVLQTNISIDSIRDTDQSIHTELQDPNMNESKVYNVLLVDDQKYNLLILQSFFDQILQKYNINIMLQKNGAEAVSMYNKHNFKKNQLKKIDLIVIDLQMPIMDGFQASQIIKRNGQTEAYHDTYILAYTGDQSERARNKCKKALIDDILIKPTNINTFSSYIERILTTENNQQNE